MTTETYDALGRLTAVWKAGRSATSDPANLKFSYSISDSAPSVVTTDTINPAGTYTVSETLYDSLGRQSETQNETADGNRDITDTYFNSDGWPLLVSNSYYTTGAPNGTLVAAPDNQVPSQTGYVYDGNGRVVRQISYKLATETWETDTTYGGNYTTVVPPAGGTSQTTFTNGEGLTSAVYQYHAGTTASPADPASDYDQTTYTYTPAQQLAAINDAAGNKWSYSYDPLGNQLSQTDPDTGKTISTYDAAGQLMSVTDARGDQTSYAYDADGRKTGEYDTTGGTQESSGNQLASWTYDTVAKGMPTAATSYYGGEAYTEQVTSYNGYGLPVQTQTIIPSAQGALAGTYTTREAYNSYTQAPDSYNDSAAGGLPAETVNTGYDAANQPDSLTSTLWYYVEGLTYTELGQPQEYTMGTTAEPAWITDTYDQQTGRVASSTMQTGATPVTVDATGYTYDNVGNVTSAADTPANGPAQAQCFQYDYLGRLTQAWSQGSSGCSSGPSQSAESGAAAPYWNSYSYNTENDLTSQTSTPASGAATTTTSSYPAGGQAQPHAVTGQQASGPSGTTSTSYAYNASGDLTSSAGGSQNESLSWDDARRLSSITTGAGTTSYLYDANGNLLVQEDPGSVSLFLHDEQLVLSTATGAVTGTRYYSLSGATVAARTTGGQVQYLDGNLQGTDTVAVDSQSMSVTRRYYDPYGNPIGTPPSAWPGVKGFTGGTTDPATALTNLGAREYSPSTSSFISADPLLNPTDPQDLNPYAYAGDNPSTFADPSGQYRLCLGGCNLPPIPSVVSSNWTCLDNIAYCSGWTAGGGGSGGAGPAASGGGGGAAGYSPAPSPGAGMLTGHLGIEPVGPTAGLYHQMTSSYKGGIVSFMAGLFDPVFQSIDIAMGVSCPGCEVKAAISGHTMGNWFLRRLAAHHIATGSDSWFGAGIGAGTAIATLAGTALGGGEAAAVTAPPAPEGVPALPAAAARLALPAGDHVPYMAGPIRSFVTSDDSIYYRVFSGDRSVGSFLTGAPPASADQAVAGLALPPANTADFIQEVLVPAGTRLQSSIAAPAFDQPGGMLQFELLERIPIKNFGEGAPFR